jgi:uncharacterized protein YcbK (DUF882 family)
MSEHFSPRELACRHCGAVLVDDKLMAGLERLRALVGRPIFVTSGYRCPQHPETLKRPGSWHARAMAADIRVLGMTARQLYRCARQIDEFGGFGVDDRRNYLHVDVRPTPARWCYDTKGLPCGWYEQPALRGLVDA